MKEPEFVAATLAWCNRQRKIKDKKPLVKLPKGRRGDPKSCPCGKATGLSVGATTYGPPGASESNLLPTQVQRFVIAFDRGLFPEYDLQPSRQS